MQLKEQINEKCDKCGSRTFKILQEEVYGCDECKKTIKLDDRTTYLDLNVFRSKDSNTARLEFCSWKCLLKFLKTIQKTKYKCDYFISLPYLHFDSGKGLSSYTEFMKAIKNFK